MEREFNTFITLPTLVKSGMLLKIWFWFLWFLVTGLEHQNQYGKLQNIINLLQFDPVSLGPISL